MELLLPGIEPGAKGKDYKKMVACEKWLGDLAGDTTWVDDMKSDEVKMQDNTPLPTRFFLIQYF